MTENEASETGLRYMGRTYRWDTFMRDTERLENRLETLGSLTVSRFFQIKKRRSVDPLVTGKSLCLTPNLYSLFP